MRETRSWTFASTNNQIQTSLALAYNLGVVSNNTPWNPPRAATEIGQKIVLNLLVLGDR